MSASPSIRYVTLPPGQSKLHTRLPPVSPNVLLCAECFSLHPLRTASLGGTILSTFFSAFNHAHSPRGTPRKECVAYAEYVALHFELQHQFFFFYPVTNDKAFPPNAFLCSMERSTSVVDCWLF